MVKLWQKERYWRSVFDIIIEARTFMGVELDPVPVSGLAQLLGRNYLVCNEQIHSELLEALTDHLWALRGRTTHYE